MKSQAIAVFMIIMTHTISSHAVWDVDLTGDEIISGATPRHLQINDGIRTFLKNRASLLNNEIKTAKIKDTNAINTILGCVVQGFEIVTLETNSFNFIKTDRKTPQKLIVMMFQPISQTLIRERYLSTNKTTEMFLKRSHSNDGVTQYINVQDNNQAVTYIGETLKKDEVWIKTFLRRQSNAKIDKGFRTTLHVNTNLLCIKL